jgi:hypothetical protein
MWTEHRGVLGIVKLGVRRVAAARWVWCTCVCVCPYERDEDALQAKGRGGSIGVDERIIPCSALMADQFGFATHLLEGHHYADRRQQNVRDTGRDQPPRQVRARPPVTGIQKDSAERQRIELLQPATNRRDTTQRAYTNARKAKSVRTAPEAESLRGRACARLTLSIR